MPSASTSWAFQCEDDSPGSVDLCFNGGVCTRDNVTSALECVCPPGFVHDFDWLHLSNCAKPAHATRDFLCFYGVYLLLLAVVYVAKIHKRLKATARFLGMMSFSTLFYEFGIVLGVYVQGGFFEFATAMSVFHFCFCCLLVRKIILIALTPVYALQRRSTARLQGFLNVFTGFTCVAFIASGIGMFITMRQPNLATFNYWSWALAESFWICGFLDTFCMFLSASKLHRQLCEMGRCAPASTSRGFDYEGLKRRLNILRFSAVGLFLPWLALAIAIPVAMLCIGSVPYYYVLFYLQMVLGATFFTSALLFFVKPNGEKTSSAVTDNNTAPLTSANHNTALVAVASVPSAQSIPTLPELTANSAHAPVSILEN